MKKFRENKHKFEGCATNSACASPPQALHGGARDPAPSSVALSPLDTRNISATRRKYLQKKWRGVFRRIIQVMKAVEVMQSEIQRKKIKGEVEPSPLLSIVCELSREACYVTKKGPSGGLLAVKRSNRPGHSDQAPVIFGNVGIERGMGIVGGSEDDASQRPSIFSFSTDILGNPIQSAVVPVLAKKPQKRSDAELLMLSRILRSLHFFEVLRNDSIVELLRSAQLVRLEAGDVLYKRGDAPEFAYCVLSGTLSVIVRYAGLNFTACDLFSGTSVGEQAIASGMPQANTVMATHRSLLLSLPSYLNVLNNMRAQDLQIKMDFLRNVTILNTISSRECLQEIAAHLRVVRVEELTQVCKAGSAITHLIFVKSGQLRTLKVVAPKSTSKGRRFVVEVQTLSPYGCFGLNAFCHISHGAVNKAIPQSIMKMKMSKKTKKTKKNNNATDNVQLGSYLGHLVSKTYCELYEIEIHKIQSILTKEQIRVLSEYGTMTKELYNKDALSIQLDSSLDWRKRRKQVLKNASQDWRALQGK